MDLMLRRTTIIGENASIQLPPGYRRVAAVGKASFGATKCQINTEYTPFSESKISVNYKYLAPVSDANQIIGSSDASDGTKGVIIGLNWFRWSTGTGSASELVFDRDGTYYSKTTWFDGTVAHLLDTGSMYTYTPVQDQQFLSSINPLYLLGRNQLGSMYGNSPACMVFSMKIWTGDVLVRDFVPCIRESDNRAGFYDLAGSISSQTGTSFYTNMAGTNSLEWEA